MAQFPDPLAQPPTHQACGQGAEDGSSETAKELPRLTRAQLEMINANMRRLREWREGGAADNAPES